MLLPPSWPSLANLSHEVHVVSSERPAQPLHKNLFFHKVETGDYPLFRHEQQCFLPFLTNKLVAWWKNTALNSSSVITPFTAQAAWMAREVLRRTRYRRAFARTLHGTVDITLVGRQHSYFELTRFTIAKQDLLTALSRFLPEYLRDGFHAAPMIST